MADYGDVTRFLLENPPAAIASGAVGTALLVAFLLRLFRNEVRSAALDKAAEGVLKSVQEDNANLRQLLKESNADRDQARRDLLECQLEFGGKVATLNAALNQLHEERTEWAQRLEVLTQRNKEAETEALKLQMQVNGQLSTIEDLVGKLRALERTVEAQRRRKTDPPL